MHGGVSRMSRLIFMSYRREDTQGFARGIYENLAKRYGRHNVFRDIDSIPAGAQFAQFIEEKIAQAGVVLALIGRDWNPAVGDSRRLDSPTDLVRVEVEAALRLKRPIIPVRISGAPMPTANDLIPSLSSLCQLNAAEISDARWEHDLARLCEAIDALFGVTTTRKLLISPAWIPSDGESEHNPRMTITFLGARGSGRSTFLLAMYAAFANNDIFGNTLRATTSAGDRELVHAWNALVDSGRFPPPSAIGGRAYAFLMTNHEDLRLPIDIITNNVPASRQAQSLAQRLVDSDCIFLAIEGGYLAQHLRAEAPSDSSPGDWLTSMAELVDEAIKRRKSKPSSLLILVTKADLLGDTLRRNRGLDVAELVRALLPACFKTGVVTRIHFVRLGRFRGSYVDQVNPAEIDPVQIHVPILHAAMQFMRGLPSPQLQPTEPEVVGPLLPWKAPQLRAERRKIQLTNLAVNSAIKAEVAKRNFWIEDLQYFLRHTTGMTFEDGVLVRHDF